MKTLLILGAGGDLTSRLLLPGLAGLLASGHVKGLTLIGSDRDDWDDAHWRKTVAASFSAPEAAAAGVNAFVGRARYLRANATDGNDLRMLVDACEEPVAIYLALPPAITAQSCRALVEIGVPAGTRLVMEKPFGTDAASADAEVVLELEGERWAGTRFRLRAGKALSRRRKMAVVRFRPGSQVTLADRTARPAANDLRIGPDGPEDMALHLTGGAPGTPAPPGFTPTGET